MKLNIVRILALIVMLIPAIGCGEKDINKNLKPISADAPRPTPAAPESGVGGGAAKAPPVMK